MAELAKETGFVLLASMVLGALKGIVSWVKSIFARSAKSESPDRTVVARVHKSHPMQALAMFGVAAAGMFAVFGSKVAADASTFNLSFLWDLLDSFDAGIPHMDKLLTDGMPFIIKVVVIIAIVTAIALLGEYGHKKLKGL
jgi:hypothetical protein